MLGIMLYTISVRHYLYFAGTCNCVIFTSVVRHFAAMWTTVYMSYFRCYLKLQTNGMGNLVEMAKILTHLKLTKENFTDMCIAAGCDYIENIRGIAINKAKKIVCENKNYLNVFQSLPFAPTDYKKRFQQAQMVFHHQTVIDPVKYETVPLSLLFGCPIVCSF